MAKLYKLALSKKLKGTAVTEKNEINKDSILTRVKLRECKRRVSNLENQVDNFKGDKKDLVKLKMRLKKEQTKLSVLEG